MPSLSRARTNLALLALALLGSEGEMHRLLGANPDLTSEPRCPGGVEIVVPTLATSAASVPASATLPPWKR